ncbi:hypothetical protein N657DRAFT_560674 [Parathielavia appendiculata]|uniref:Rhodopsin domain-containing protein n=1 Tax=Parathielavia appendiculata TaxID=2587402 RepID=A0AAN6Z8U3_9PEZI|nr:hypothetical protein N657DRAFT_560674 [Parathielavia appendiculata]
MASLSANATPDDLGPKVEIVSWLLIGLSAVFLGLRVFCKFRTHRALWWDDHVLIVSWVFQLIAVCFTTASVRLGLGRHIYAVDPANLAPLGLNSNVSSTFAVLAAVLSKTSFALTLLRITEGYTKIAIWVIIAIMNSAMWLTALFVWIKCNPPRKTWDRTIPGTCWDSSSTSKYDIFSAAISGVGDIALSLLPWKVLFNLQIKRKEKIGVGFAMSMGVFAGGTAFVKCAKLPELEYGDPTYYAADVAIWATAETATTIMAASLPVLRVLLQYVKSSARKYSSERYGPSGDASHVKGTRATRGATTTVTVTRNGPRSHAIKDDDSDKSILDRPVGGGNQIVQTNEYIVEFHEQDRAKINEDSDSMGGYEMTNRAPSRLQDTA